MPARVFLSAVLLFSAVPLAQGATFLQEKHVAIHSPLGDDLYATGEKVTLSEEVKGDSIIAAGVIEMDGKIQNDLAAAGGTLYIEGSVGDDARLAGGTVHLSGIVKDDVIIAGGTVNITKGAVIEGDLLVFGGTIRVEGVIKGNARVFGESVTMDATIDGNLEVRVDNLSLGGTVKGISTLSAQRITIEQGATFEKPVRYWTEEGAIPFGSSLKNTTAMLDPALGPKVSDKAAAVGAAAIIFGTLTLYALLSGALLILLLVLFTKKTFAVASKKIFEQPGWHFVLGLLYLILTPIVTLLLFVSIIGIPLALLLLTSYIFTLLFASVFTAVTFAKWLELRYRWKLGKPALFGVSICLLIVLRLLSLVPIVGWIIKGVLISMTLGALLAYKTNIWKKMN